MSSVATLNPPRVELRHGFQIVRDDCLPGGTKSRFIHLLFDDRDEYVYASPVYGHAQIALANQAGLHGKRATIFTAARRVPHPLTLRAESLGATVVPIRPGYLTVVQKRARDYCKQTGAKLIEFGADDPRIVSAIADCARTIDPPGEVWCVAGSGTLCRGLCAAWPDAVVNAVRVGKEPDIDRAKLWTAPEAFQQAARTRPPFPSSPEYDAKAWQFILEHATPGALFWNVA